LSRLDERGVRVVTDVGCGMRWTLRRHKTNDVATDGEVVWSWHPDAGVKLAKTLARLAGDGDY
jgi:hypothetical protein